MTALGLFSLALLVCLHRVIGITEEFGAFVMTPALPEYPFDGAPRARRGSNGLIAVRGLGEDMADGAGSV